MNHYQQQLQNAETRRTNLLLKLTFDYPATDVSLTLGMYTFRPTVRNRMLLVTGEEVRCYHILDKDHVFRSMYFWYDAQDKLIFRPLIWEHVLVQPLDQTLTYIMPHKALLDNALDLALQQACSHVSTTQQPMTHESFKFLLRQISHRLATP